MRRLEEEFSDLDFNIYNMERENSDDSYFDFWFLHLKQSEKFTKKTEVKVVKRLTKDQYRYLLKKFNANPNWNRKDREKMSRQMGTIS